MCRWSRAWRTCFVMALTSDRGRPRLGGVPGGCSSSSCCKELPRSSRTRQARGRPPLPVHSKWSSSLTKWPEARLQHAPLPEALTVLVVAAAEESALRTFSSFLAACAWDMDEMSTTCAWGPCVRGREEEEGEEKGRKREGHACRQGQTLMAVMRRAKSLDLASHTDPELEKPSRPAKR